MHRSHPRAVRGDDPAESARKSGRRARKALGTGESATAVDQREQCVGGRPASKNAVSVALGLREPTGRVSARHRAARHARRMGHRIPSGSTGEPVTGGSAHDVRAACLRQDECDWIGRRGARGQRASESGQQIEPAAVESAHPTTAAPQGSHGW